MVQLRLGYRMRGLPGVKTSCQCLPGYQSKHCHSHAPRISRRAVEADTQQESFEEITVQLCQETDSWNILSGVFDIGLCVCVHVCVWMCLRIFFQVKLAHEEKTWEPASSLPQVLIHDMKEVWFANKVL